MIGPLQEILPDNTQHSHQADIYAPEKFEPAIPASERPQTEGLDRTATGIGSMFRVKYKLNILLKTGQNLRLVVLKRALTL
jgi:hypothetical protein